MKTERGVLLLSALMSVVVGSAAVTAASITQSKAILLDGLFNLVYFLVALVTVRISALTTQPDDRKFPFGYGYFESLVNAGKGLLILGVALFALVDALIALSSGGREILAGPAIVYAVFATLACSFTAWTLRRSLGHLDTPLVRADYENWLINALISSSVLLTFCFLPVARWLGWYQILPYVDSVLVIAVAAPAQQGRANRALVKFVGEMLGVAAGQIEITRGQSSTHKTLCISNLGLPQISKRVQACLEQL